jgi:transcriptional regulator with XRE-family HTH domain
MDSNSTSSQNVSADSGTSIDIDRIFEELKSVLKERGLTYKQLADRIGVTEGAVKKTLTADDISLGRLSAIAEAAGVTVRELFRRLDHADEVRFQLTEAQELYFSQHPKTLRFFLLLLEASASVVMKEQKLAAEKCLRYLDELEKLGLVAGAGLERRPKTQAKILKWNPNGPYAKTQNRKITQQLVDHLYAQDVSALLIRNRASGYMLPATQEEFVARMQALSKEFMSRARKENSALPREQLKSVTWAFLMGEFDVWRALLDGEEL